MVRDRCLAYALDTRQLHGVWGGTDPAPARRVRESTLDAPLGS
nr:WhiB family transcriptional regulator [Nonomuraea endophytica]